jgi:multidrug efflux pump subunit AcrB
VRIADLYRKPVASTTGLCIVLIVSGVIVAGARFGPSGAENGAAFSVIVEHFGVDAQEIERTITKPLEDTLGTLPGLKGIRSLSDYGSSRVTVFMRPGTSSRETYLQLRDAVDRVYGELPGSVQRPRILSSGEEGRPVFIASVRSSSMELADLASLLEKELKPSLEKIEGASEVEIGGGSPREIHVVLDGARASRAGMDAAAVARAIQANEMLAPLGSVFDEGKEIPVVLSGRLGNLDGLRGLCLPAAGSNVTLGSMTNVGFGMRERGEISRVNGVENAVLALKSSGGANLIELSRAVREEIKRWEKQGLSFDVVLDAGAELERSLRSILEAILFAMLVSAITLPLFITSPRRVLVLSASIPVIGVASAAAVSVAGLNLDSYTLSGLAIGMGTMVDTGIIIAGRASPRLGRDAYFTEVERIIPALMSSTVTALIVLMPLLALDFGAGAIREVSLSLAVLMGMSFILSCLFVPAYAASAQPVPVRTYQKPTDVANSLRMAGMALARKVISACGMRRVWPLAGGIAVSAMGVWAVATIGIDLEPQSQTDSIPVHVECESGASIDSVDASVTSFTSRLRRLRGVTVIQSTARRGSAELEVGFDPALTTRESLSETIRVAGRSIPGGFAYLPEGAGKTERPLEIAITGDDDAALRGYASRAAALLSHERKVKEVVLNFKEPAPSYIFAVDPERTATVGASAEAVAGALRWHLYGPVAMKWIGGEGEVDLRVMGDRARQQTLADLQMIPVPSGQAGTVPLQSTGSFFIAKEGGKLYRLNRQRAVYLTAHVEAGDIRQIVIGVERALGTLKLAPGYAFDVGRDLTEQAEKFQTLWLTFALCILLVYLVLGTLTESFFWPLVILAVLPASITLPLIIMKVTGQRLIIPVLIGLIVLSGMAVNNSILIVDAYRATGRRSDGERKRSSPADGSISRTNPVTEAVVSRLSALTATSGVTILGHLPLLFAAGQGASFMRSLAFVIIWGIAGSYAATIFVIPALLSLAAKRSGLVRGVQYKRE